MRVRPVKEYNDARLYTGFAAVANGACAPAPNGGNTAPGGGLGLDLAAIAEQLNDIAAELRGEGHIGAHLLHSRGEVGGHDPRRTPAIRPDPQIDLLNRRSRYADFAREAYATRRRRAAIFGSDELFGEPAWDILLDLYVADADKKPVSVSSACIGSAAPPTTGLRWLGVLAEHNLVMREHDPEDQRRVLVRLTERGLEAMDDYFASAGITV